ncbi:hypothetical protein [Luteimonas terricola]|uniref:Uncharacterized protein n=1 Tax=Luteimonas terricola TaxID=645597 RepID=A0ABQ2EB26_9GAMM|nr:hypothetical protein [Luteimonas terricola]GGJ98161.1 hypothetical protein GCM10011394_03850 [Luteimonas terricola]
MNGTIPADNSTPELEQAIAELEGEMGDLQLKHRDLFAHANAWAERHDAIMRLAPPHLREITQARLRRIAIRWGLAEGARMTAQFPALREA